jgi:DNA-directed RNA polymerase
MDEHCEIELPRELELARLKFDRREDRTAQMMGLGDTEVGLKITRKFLPKITEVFEKKLSERHPPQINPLIAKLRALGATKVALCALQMGIHAVGVNCNLREAALTIGGAIADECWAAKLTNDNPRLAARVEKAARARGRLEQRKGLAKSIAAADGFRERTWSKKLRIEAGEFLLDCLLQGLPDVFCILSREDGAVKNVTVTTKLLAFTDSTWEHIGQVISEIIDLNPVWQPSLEPPTPWTGWNKGGSPDPRVRASVTILRSGHKDRIAAGRHAIKDSSMRPALDALNTLQGVPWSINKRVLGVLQACIERGIEVKGLPLLDARPTPERITPQVWATMTVDQRKRAAAKRKRIKVLNISDANERVLLGEDVAEAARLAEHPRFFTGMNCDWRGRVYPISHFNFQRDDRVRALFQFADGEPITEEGIYWLKIHLANCGDFNKVSKRPLEERTAWVDQNLAQIEEVAISPLSLGSRAFWTKADKPFLFLAACLELSSAISAGTSYVTRLPISFDGSCSGLQHLCAMTRAPEGALVNLTPQPEPQDVYQHVANMVIERLRADDTELGKLALKYMLENNARKVVKRNVMTYAYSSRAFGMAGQQDEDLIQPIADEVASGKLEDHPFGEFADRRGDVPSNAARFLAAHVFKAIEEVVNYPAQAMAFLRKLAQTLAHEGKPLRWTTPVGIPWINRYHKPTMERCTLWLHDRGVKTRYQTMVATGDEQEIWKEKSANSVSPNFVHALDASALMLCVNAAAAEGITAQATVHDSFSCLASRAGRYRQIIRETFVQMYESHDVLKEILEQAKCDLTQAYWHRLPDVPDFGNLNLKDMLNAEYAFA